MKKSLLSILLVFTVGCSYNTRTTPVVQTLDLPLAKAGYQLIGLTSAKACRPNILNPGFFDFDHWNSGLLKANMNYAETSPVEFAKTVNEDPELVSIRDKNREEKSFASSYYNPIVWIFEPLSLVFNGLRSVTTGGGIDSSNFIGTEKPITPNEAENVGVEYPQNTNRSNIRFSKPMGPVNLSDTIDQLNTMGVRTVAMAAYYEAISKVNADYIIDGSVDVDSTIRVPGIILLNDYCVTVSGTGVVLTEPTTGN